MAAELRVPQQPMDYHAEIKFRTGEDKEGVCRLYFDSERAAQLFVDAAKLSDDLEFAEVYCWLTKRIIHTWEK